jgi:hypothetical protein
MGEGYGNRRYQVVARAGRRLRASGSRLGAAAAALVAAVLGTLAAASLLQAGAAAGAVATTTSPEAITGALVE